MVVPYGDPGPTQRRKNAFDVGEYGMGMCANSLELGCDCLGLIRYFDAHLCDSRGEPLTIKNAVCMHEEDYGILWKHTDRRLPDSPEVAPLAPAGRLVDLDGRELRIRLLLVSLPGRHDPVRGEADGHPLAGCLSARRDARSRRPGRPPALCAKSSAFLQHAPRLRSRRHCQHRLPDRRGGRSDRRLQPVRKRLSGRRDPADDRRSRREDNFKLETARTWKIVNPGVQNAVGEPVGYKFLPGDNSFPLASPAAWWRKRAGFVNHHVWVTPYRRGGTVRRRANYPNQSRGGDGLPRWTEQDRPIENTDVVLWYTFGHTHIPRPEDYPVMPTAYIGFTLKPNGFFTANPANDVPPSPKKTGSCCH